MGEPASGSDGGRELSGSEDLRAKLREAASKALAGEVSDPLELAILENLVGGAHSTAELVEEIYGSKRDEPGYMTNYTRARRALDRLSSRGYVSRRLFGSVKDYRLTQYGFERLARLASGVEKPRVLPANDRVLHLVTLSVAVLLLLSASGRMPIPGSFLILLDSLFFFMLGLSVSRIVRGLGMVL